MVDEKIIVKNHYDVYESDRGSIVKNNIRSMELDAVVDKGAAFLCLTPGIIEELGLVYSHTRDVKTANGDVKRRIFRTAEIIIKGRKIIQSVMENDMKTPPLIGYLVLEEMDFVVDPGSQKIIGNPEHDGKWVVDLY